MCREKEAVVDIKTFRVTAAICPGDDVTGAEQSRLSYAGERTAALPISQQRPAENVLPDTLFANAVNFCGAEPGDLVLIGVQRHIWQGAREFVHAVERGAHRALVRKAICGPFALRHRRRGRRIELGGYAGVVDR